MNIAKCDMCGIQLKCGLATPAENEGKEQAKSTVKIEVISNRTLEEDSFKFLELCESCHYRLIDFIENSVPIYSTLGTEEKIVELPKLKWWQRLFNR